MIFDCLKWEDSDYFLNQSIILIWLMNKSYLVILIFVGINNPGFLLIIQIKYIYFFITFPAP